MGDIKLLDCTLRDGGYVNDWEFGHNHLCSIFQRLADTKVEFIEIGFLDERRPFDMNRSIMPDTRSAERIYGRMDKGRALVLGMIDYGTCGLQNIQPVNETFIDGIRVIFKKHIMHEALGFCADLKKLGYIVFAQLVSITSYSEEELMELIGLVNDVRPYAVSMVDTYGLLDPEKLRRYFSILNRYVDESICIGFHAHNNFQLGFANVMSMVAYVPEDESENRILMERSIVVDGTLFGMGKSAGNAPLELIAMYLNEKYGRTYSINSMLEAIEESIMDFYVKSPWGYKTYFYLSALNRCHPNYVKQFQDKGNLSVSALNDILGKIEPEEKKLLYDRHGGEELYKAFEDEYYDDGEVLSRLKNVLKDKKLLLIGPGKNIRLQGERVGDFIRRQNPVIISINYIPGEMKVHYVFITKSKRYLEMAEELLEIKNEGVELIVTSNVSAKGRLFDYVVSKEPLLEHNQRIKDNSFIMFLKILQACEIKTVWCAGFDGYSSNEDNYFKPAMEYAFVKDEACNLNYHVKEILENMRGGGMKVEFITYSHYLDEMDIHLASF